MIRKLAFGFLATAGAVCAHAQTIDTFTGWNGTSFIGDWGPADTPVFGQTFTAPASDTLDGFDFYMKNLGGAIKYQFGIMDWDGTKATGAPLYLSGVQTLASSTVDTGFQKLSFAPLATVSSGGHYVAFLSTLDVTQTGNVSHGLQGARQSNAYAGGNWVWLNASSSGDLTAAPWDGPLFDFSNDMAFTARFSTKPVPEPASCAALAFGALGVLGRRRARKG